jgi:hypothetical protein
VNAVVLPTSFLRNNPSSLKYQGARVGMRLWKKGAIRIVVATTCRSASRFKEP